MSDSYPNVTSPGEPGSPENAPEPQGPKPVTESDPVMDLLTGAGVFVAAVGSLFALADVTTTRTCGATRSASLIHQQRMAEIETAANATQESDHEIAVQPEPGLDNN